MIRWCEHNRRSDGARGPQRRPCPLARGTRCVAGPGRGGSRPVSGHALHELSCPRGCGNAHPGGHAGDRWAGGGRRRWTSVRACGRGGHQHGHVYRTLAVRMVVIPEAADGQSADGINSLQLPLLSSRPACGRPPAAAVLGRQPPSQASAWAVPASPSDCAGLVLAGLARPFGRGWPAATSAATSDSLRPEDRAARRRWVNAS
jgi:hypothetical protein